MNLSSIKPLNEKYILKILKKYKNIITVEDHSTIGGLGSVIAEIIDVTMPTPADGPEAFSSSEKTNDTLHKISNTDNIVFFIYMIPKFNYNKKNNLTFV